MRKVKFHINGYYHIYNRGVDKRDIFIDDSDYIRFLKGMREFNNESKYEERVFIKNSAGKEAEAKKALSAKTSASALSAFLAGLPKLVDIVCYCLNPNHYHFILKQLEEGGVSKFMHRIDMGYTNYFNLKNNRNGSLFQGRYKATCINSDEHLLWMSGYVNGNSEIHKIVNMEDYQWCGYQDYLGKRQGALCEKKLILNQFKNIKAYQKFIKKVIQEYQERKEVLKFIIQE